MQVAGNPWNSKVFGVFLKSDRAEEYCTPASVENSSKPHQPVWKISYQRRPVWKISKPCPPVWKKKSASEPVWKTVKTSQPDNCPL
jgi:hypothetical protein